MQRVCVNETGENENLIPIYNETGRDHREAMLNLAAHSGVDGAFLLDKDGNWLYQPVNWEITNRPNFRLLKEDTIADLKTLIWRIPSLTHISEESRQEWLREAHETLEMVLNA